MSPFARSSGSVIACVGFGFTLSWGFHPLKCLHGVHVSKTDSFPLHFYLPENFILDLKEKHKIFRLGLCFD